MINRSLDALIPEMKEKAEKMLYRLNQKGLRVMISETRRTLDIQEAYMAQGRDTLENVNKLRVKAGLWKISEIENKNIITKTMKSKHLEGKAIDIAPLTPEGKAWWNAPPAIWEAMGLIGESVGLNWGGRWKGFKDSPHFEI